MFKKTLLAITFILFSQATPAKVIELDNMNPDTCRQQIITGGDEKPMVMTYLVGCSWAAQLRPLLEDVSEMFPNRRFYAFAFADDNSMEDDYNRARTAQACLGFIPTVSPRVVMYKVKPTTSDHAGRIKGLLKMDLDGGSTKADIIKFMEPVDEDLQRKFTILKNS